jgi:hypothetical protein
MELDLMLDVLICIDALLSKKKQIRPSLNPSTSYNGMAK